MALGWSGTAAAWVTPWMGVPAGEHGLVAEPRSAHRGSATAGWERQAARLSVGPERRDEHHGALEVEVDGPTAEVLRPVDQEGGLVGDGDGTTVTESGQAVLQTGGYAAVSPTRCARPDGAGQEVHASERAPAGQVGGHGALVGGDGPDRPEQAEVVLAAHDQLMDAWEDGGDAVAHPERQRLEVDEAHVAVRARLGVQRDGDRSGVDRLGTAHREAHALLADPVQPGDAEDDPLRRRRLGAPLRDVIRADLELSPVPSGRHDGRLPPVCQAARRSAVATDGSSPADSGSRAVHSPARSISTSTKPAADRWTWYSPSEWAPPMQAAHAVRLP